MNAPAADDGLSHLPLGDNSEDGEHRNLRLLKRALIEKRRVTNNSIRYAGNEFFSNIPTFYNAVDNAQVGYIAASCFAVAILGIIGYRGMSQNTAYHDVLKIWSEFEFNLKADEKLAYEVLEKRMQAKGLLFSAIPDHNLQNFKRTEHRAAAIKQGFWQTTESTSSPDDEQHDISQLSILDAFHAHGLKSAFKTAAVRAYNAPVSLRNAAEASGRRAKNLQQSYFNAVDKVVDTSTQFTGEQLKDLLKNPLHEKTYKDIGGGIYAMLSSTKAIFDVAASNAKTAYIIRKQASESTAQNSDDVHDPSDSELIEEAKSTREDLKHYYKDGAIMSTALTFETGFCAAHFYEAHHAIEEGDWWNLGVSVYSLAMASGAFAYLGRQVSSTIAVARSERAKMAIQVQTSEASPT